MVAYFAPTDLARWMSREHFPATKLTVAEAAQYSPIRFVGPASAPTLIVHGDADEVVPIVEGETMYAALEKAGVPALFLRIAGAGHQFEGAELERVNATMLQWFEQHLRGAA